MATEILPNAENTADPGYPGFEPTRPWILRAAAGESHEGALRAVGQDIAVQDPQPILEPGRAPGRGAGRMDGA